MRIEEIATDQRFEQCERVSRWVVFRYIARSVTINERELRARLEGDLANEDVLQICLRASVFAQREFDKRQETEETISD